MFFLAIIMFFLPYAPYAYSMIEGKIVFSSTHQFKPLHIPIYYAGKKIDCDSDESQRAIIFRIPKQPSQQEFDIVITDSITPDCVSKKNHSRYSDNIIRGLRVPEKSEYRWYRVSLKVDYCDDFDLNTMDYDTLRQKLSQKETEPKKKPEKKWLIVQKEINSTNRLIPEEAIIILWPSSNIVAIKETAITQLPSIMVKANDFNDLRTTEKQQLVAALDLDTIHGKYAGSNDLTKKQVGSRILVAPPIT